MFQGWFCVRVDGRGRPVLRFVRTDWSGLSMVLRHEWETLVYGGLPASRAPWWRGSTVAAIAPEV